MLYLIVYEIINKCLNLFEYRLWHHQVLFNHFLRTLLHLALFMSLSILFLFMLMSWSPLSFESTLGGSHSLITEPRSSLYTNRANF
jgi:hypothetical protein